MSLKFFMVLVMALTAQTAIFASPASADPNTCVASAPDGSTLTVFDQPDAQSAVLGGIGVGQCNVNVTNQCQDHWCVIVYQGLNGWVEMQHISGSPVQPPAAASQHSGGGAQTFEVVGGSGTITMMGQTQPTPVDAGGTVTLTPIDATTAQLRMPAVVFPGQPTMRRGPSGDWTGTFGEWAGIPANVTVTLRALETPAPLLVLDGTSAMANFAMQLQLRPVGRSQTAQPGQTSGDMCARLDAISAQINAAGGTDSVQELRGIYVLAELAFGAPQTEAKCQRALDLIAASPMLQAPLAGGSSNGPVPNPVPAPSQTQRQQQTQGLSPACREVLAIDQAVEAVDNPTVAMVFASSMQSIPIPDVFSATEGQCLALLELLAMEGLGSPEQVVLEAPNFGQAPSPVSRPNACDALASATRPILRGRDAPAREMVLSVLQANGAANPASASPQACAQAMSQLIAAATIPDDGWGWGNAGQQTTPQARPGASISNSSCLELGDRLVTAVNRGANRELIALADILAATGIRSLSGETDTACAAALDAAGSAGLGR